MLQPGVTESLDGEPAHDLLHLGGEHGEGGEDGQQDTINVLLDISAGCQGSRARPGNIGLMNALPQ